MPTQAALSGRSERTAILSTHSLYATATNGTNFPLSAYRARLHVPEAYSTAQPSGLLAASPFPCVGCWPKSPSPSFLFFQRLPFYWISRTICFWSGRYVRFLSAKLEVAWQTPSLRCTLTLKNRHWPCRVQFSNVRACLIASVRHLSGCLENRI